MIRKGSATTGPIDQSKPAVGVDHTTESSIMPSSFSRGIPHFAPGPLHAGGRPKLTQWLPLGHYGTALQNDPGGLETNRWIRVQIEIVGYSSLDPWLPASPEYRSMLASLYEWCSKELGIPERSVFPNTLQRGTVWATEHNSHRKASRFGQVAGWYGHVDVPENDHWDPGSLKRDHLLGQEPELELVTRYGIKAVGKVDGHREGWELTAPTFTLKELGTMIARDKDLREKMRMHTARGRRLVFARRAIPKP